MDERSALQPAVVEFLLSARGQAALTALEGLPLEDTDTLPVLDRLRRTLTGTEAGATLALARLRRKAVDKFPAADTLFFTATALEQATAAPIAAHRAAWLDEIAPPGLLLDLGCGIGGDLLALAQRRPVVAYELDPVCARFAATNAAMLGLADRVEVRHRDWTADLASGRLPPASAAFADPARRVDGRRVFRLAQLVPPFAALHALQPRVAVLGVKVMPGIADDDLPADCGVEFISHAGVCKEAVLWFGPAARYPRWATVLTGDGAHTAVADAAALPVGPLRASQVLYEPDPALIRAHALGELSTRLAAQLFDPQIAYLIADEFRAEPLAQAFLVEEVHTFHLARLNQRLQALGVAQVELKKRGFPVEPESLRSKLRLAQVGRAATVILTRRGDERLMLICRRLSATA